MPTTMDTGMKHSTFETFCDIVYAQAGISLTPRKEALVKARVAKRMRVLGISSYDEYLEVLGADESGCELTLFLDAICTNVTSFFREPHHFEFLAGAMCDWLGQGQRRFRFWSAASSTGEEPISLALTLLEATAQEPGIDMRILGTDLSTAALDNCLAARYGKDRIANVPPGLRNKWFDVIKEGGDTAYRPKQALRDMIVYRRMNLATPPFPMNGPLDAVFCRNVMIYFDNPVRIALLNEVHRLLKPGGFLFVGHAESLTGIVGDFRYVEPGVYMRRP